MGSPKLALGIALEEALRDEEVAPVLAVAEKGVRTAVGHARLVSDENEFLAMMRLRDLLRSKADEIDAELQRRDPARANLTKGQMRLTDEMHRLKAEEDLGAAKNHQDTVANAPVP